jgi:hypothetical protein
MFSTPLSFIARGFGLACRPSVGGEACSCDGRSVGALLFLLHDIKHEGENLARLKFLSSHKHKLLENCNLSNKLN